MGERQVVQLRLFPQQALEGVGQVLAIAGVPGGTAAGTGHPAALAGADVESVGAGLGVAIHLHRVGQVVDRRRRRFLLRLDLLQFGLRFRLDDFFLFHRVLRFRRFFRRRRRRRRQRDDCRHLGGLGGHAGYVVGPIPDQPGEAGEQQGAEAPIEVGQGWVCRVAVDGQRGGNFGKNL